MPSNCEECVWYDYDDELDAYVCEAELDEDEMERFLRGGTRAVPLLPPRRRLPDCQTTVKEIDFTDNAFKRQREGRAELCSARPFRALSGQGTGGG